jgi:hypothetical protein
MAYLAKACQEGRGTRKNRPLALRRYQEAAEAGCVMAMACLGDYYLDESPTKEDVKAGLRWLRLAASRPIDMVVPSTPGLEDYDGLAAFIAALETEWTVDAHEHLALRYDEGLPGLRRNPAKAASLLDKLLRAGYLENARELCRLYDELDEGQEAERVLEILVASGDVEAMKELGIRLTRSGNSRERSIRGLQLIDRAAKTPVKPRSDKKPVKWPAKRKHAPPAEDRVPFEFENRLMQEAQAYLDKDPPEYRMCIRVLHCYPDLFEYAPAVQMRADLMERLGGEAYESHMIIHAIH